MVAKKIKQILFVTTFISVFIYIYRQSNRRGLNRWINSLKVAFMITLALLNFTTSIRQESTSEGLNRISRSNSNQIERVIKSEHSTQILDLRYLNRREIKRDSSKALALSRNIQAVNSNPDSVSPIVSQMLKMRGGDNWKFSPGSRARGAAARNAGKSAGPFVYGFTPLNPYKYQHRYPTRIPAKIQPNRFQPRNGGGETMTEIVIGAISRVVQARIQANSITIILPKMLNLVKTEE